MNKTIKISTVHYEMLKGIITMSSKSLPRISAVHYEMLKGIMKKRGIRKEDECIEEMIQEQYNTKRR